MGILSVISQSISFGSDI